MNVPDGKRPVVKQLGTFTSERKKSGSHHELVSSQVCTVDPL